MLFTRERAHAASLLKPNMRLVFVDVPANRLAEIQVARAEPDRMVVMPIALAEGRVTLVQGGETPTALRQLRTRTAEAVARMDAREIAKTLLAQLAERAKAIASVEGPARQPTVISDQRDGVEHQPRNEKPQVRGQKQ